MSYSLRKLDKIFESKGFVINKLYYRKDDDRDNYKYIEIIYIKDATIVLIDLGKYEITRESKISNAYEILPQTVLDDDYNTLPEQIDISSSYSEISHIDNALESEEKALDMYNREILLNKPVSKSQDNLKSVYKQLKRLLLTVKGLSYKISIIDTDCLCSLNSKNDIQAYTVKNYTNVSRQIIITMSIEDFVRTENINDDVNKILFQFYDILNKNQTHQTHKIQTMIDSKKSIVKSSNNLLSLKKKFMDKISKLQHNFKDISEKETETYRKIKSGSLSDDVKYKYEQSLDTFEQSRKAIINEIVGLKNELNHITLSVDNLLFDNMLMLIRIANNFKLLDNISTRATKDLINGVK